MRVEKESREGVRVEKESELIKSPSRQERVEKECE